MSENIPSDGFRPPRALNPFTGRDPFSLINETPSLGCGQEGQALKTLLEQYCQQCGFEASVKEHPEHGWTFYRIRELKTGQTLEHPIAARYFDERLYELLCASERAMEDVLIKVLTGLMQPSSAITARDWVENHPNSTLPGPDGRPSRQYATAAGIIDVLTCREIFELKRELTNATFQQAIGQLMLYRRALNDRFLDAIVIGRPNTELTPGLIEIAGRLGIHVMFWPDKSHIPYLEDRLRELIVTRRRNWLMRLERECAGWRRNI